MDAKRNGNRKAEELIHHVGQEHARWLGPGRLATGVACSRSQAQAGVLVEAWVKTSAACPN
jgi:hypothetical protein